MYTEYFPPNKQCVQTVCFCSVNEGFVHIGLLLIANDVMNCFVAKHICAVV